METLIKARQVANYVRLKWQIPRRKRSAFALGPVSENIAAILVDAIFQAGLNYRNVVFPRVCAVASSFPRMNSLGALEAVLSTETFISALSWNHPEKPQRLRSLISFFRSRGLDTISHIREWLCNSHNREQLLTLRGIGHKTVDYLSRLVGLATIAVDRHAHRLLKEVGIVSHRYEEAKRILEFAADLLRMNRAAFDHMMWETLSTS